VSSKKNVRMIDKEEIKALVHDLHMKQLHLLLEKMEDGYLEPQEQRLIWDMVKTHNIGIDSVEDMVNRTNEGMQDEIDNIESKLEGAWTFD
jgi:hypothetical protein